MNSHKQTKRALLTSVMALVMCVVMLVGTTFAWFTDTAKTNVNKIEAGKLKVDIVGADKDTTTGKYPSLTGEGSKLNFVKASDAEENERILWEPGCTYQTEGFRIQSKGNLALKWKVQINKGWTSLVEQHHRELLDVIEFSIINEAGDAISLKDFEGHLNGVDAVSGIYKLQGKMKTTAGNEYQDLDIRNVTITVFATQNTVEHDSFRNDYDADAKNPQVTNQEEFLAALNSAVDGQAIYLAAGDYGTIEMIHAFKNPGVKNIKLVGADGTSIGLWFGKNCAAVEGWTFENINFIGADYGLTFDCVNKDITVKNCTFTGGRFASSGAAATTTNLTIDGCAFKDTAYEEANKRLAVYITNNDGVTIKDCTFDNAGYNAIQIGAMQGNVTIENNRINNTHDRALRFTAVAANADVTVTIKNNTITDAKKDGEVLKANNSKNYTITLENNTWDGKADSEMQIENGNDYIVKLPG